MSHIQWGLFCLSLWHCHRESAMHFVNILHVFHYWGGKEKGFLHVKPSLVSQAYQKPILFFITIKGCSSVLWSPGTRVLRWLWKVDVSLRRSSREALASCCPWRWWGSYDMMSHYAKEKWLPWVFSFLSINGFMKTLLFPTNKKQHKTKKKVLFLFELFQAVLAKFFSYAMKVRNTQLKCLKNMFKKC